MGFVILAKYFTLDSLPALLLPSEHGRAAVIKASFHPQPPFPAQKSRPSTRLPGEFNSSSGDPFCFGSFATSFQGLPLNQWPSLQQVTVPAVSPRVPMQRWSRAALVLGVGTGILVLDQGLPLQKMTPEHPLRPRMCLNPHSLRMKS